MQTAIFQEENNYKETLTSLSLTTLFTIKD